MRAWSVVDGRLSVDEEPREMQDLNIDVMCANGAAAKGRVERTRRCKTGWSKNFASPA